MSISVRNINGYIHIKHPSFKISVPLPLVETAFGALRFAQGLAPETEKEESKGKGKRRGRPAKATFKAVTSESAPAVEVAASAPKKVKAIAAVKVETPASLLVAATSAKVKVADVVHGCLNAGITSRSSIISKLTELGFRPGPVAIYFNNQTEKGNLIVKGDTLSLPS